ncbi:MAG: hypothetical protein D6798_19305 [Deltaproteobacteria bacterium]|nr:MAG: hypothetical protein D6798_19305 [Deltaproteobacteria bacterium]
MTARIPLSLLSAGLLALPLALACGDDKGDDTGGGSDGGAGDGGSDGGASAYEDDCSDGLDNDNDGLTDCDDSDCASDTEACPEPPPDITALNLTWSDSIIGSAHGDVTYNGTALGSGFSMILSTDNWSGDPSETDEYCEIFWSTQEAPVSTGCANCWAGMAWDVDTTVYPELYGDICGDLDPDIWGKDVAEGFMGADFTVGYGQDKAGMVSTALNKYGYGDYGFDETTLWGAFIASEAFGLTSSALPENQWGIGFAYAVDETGEITKGWAAIQGPFPPDGYYIVQDFYYFPIDK